MSKELIEYLKKSRQGRRELIDKAEEFMQPLSSTNFLQVSNQNDLEFPLISPQRFTKFKDQVEVNLGYVFRPDKKQIKQIPVLRSLSKEETYKMVYLKNCHKKKLSSGADSSTYSVERELKPLNHLLPRSRYRENYLLPVLSSLKKNKLNVIHH